MDSFDTMQAEDFYSPAEFAPFDFEENVPYMTEDGEPVTLETLSVSGVVILNPNKE